MARATYKQILSRRTNLLPRSGQKPQDFATDSTLIGYARVSKAEGQELALQLNALEAAGCRRVYEEKASGGRWDRAELSQLLTRMRRGDAEPRGEAE